MAADKTKQGTAVAAAGALQRVEEHGCGVMPGSTAKRRQGQQRQRSDEKGCWRLRTAPTRPAPGTLAPSPEFREPAIPVGGKVVVKAWQARGLASEKPPVGVKPDRAS